jgi:transposase
MITLGIDCHKKYSQVAVLNAQGKFLMDARLSNNKEQFAQLIDGLDGPFQAVIETGYTWGVMYDLLSDLGVDVTVAHALKVKAIASAKIKTDKIDARVLADLLKAELIPEVYIPPKDIRQQKDLLRQRCWLVKSKTALKNRIHQILTRNHVEESGFSDLFGVGGRKFLDSLTLNGPDQNILRQNLELYDFINEQIKETTHWVKDLLKDNRYREVLESLPGFGTILSSLAALEICEISRFAHEGKLSAYSGLVPSTYASGGKVYHGDLIPQCNKWLKYAFVEAAWVAIGCSPYFRGLFTRMKKNKGANTAIIAVARRLCEIAYICLKENRFYEERPYISYRKKIA